MSLISTYQSRKTLFAEKLNNIGITEASESDGLTTLINYIDDIETGSISDGVIIVSNKNEIINNESCTLGAIGIENGNLMNENITIYCVKDSFSNSLKSNNNGFEVYNSRVNGNNISITSEGGVIGERDVRIRCTTPINLMTDTVQISFKCKARGDSNYAICGQIGNLGDWYESAFSISSNGVGIGENYSSLPNNFDIYEWMDVMIEISPIYEKIYINGNLMATYNYEFDAEELYGDDVYFTVWNPEQSSPGFILKDFSIINILSVVGTGNNGVCNGTYVGTGGGTVDFVAKCGTLINNFEIMDSPY